MGIEPTSLRSQRNIIAYYTTTTCSRWQESNLYLWCQKPKPFHLGYTYIPLDRIRTCKNCSLNTACLPFHHKLLNSCDGTWTHTSKTLDFKSNASTIPPRIVWDGNWTHTLYFADIRNTFMLPNFKAAGFEPTISYTQNRCNTFMLRLSLIL